MEVAGSAVHEFALLPGRGFDVDAHGQEGRHGAAHLRAVAEGVRDGGGEGEAPGLALEERRHGPPGRGVSARGGGARGELGGAAPGPRHGVAEHGGGGAAEHREVRVLRARPALDLALDRRELVVQHRGAARADVHGPASETALGAPRGFAPLEERADETRGVREEPRVVHVRVAGVVAHVVRHAPGVGAPGAARHRDEDGGTRGGGARGGADARCARNTRRTVVVV